MKGAAHYHSDVEGYNRFIHEPLIGEFSSLEAAQRTAMALRPPEDGFVLVAVEDVEKGNRLWLCDSRVKELFKKLCD